MNLALHVAFDELRELVATPFAEPGWWPFGRAAASPSTTLRFPTARDLRAVVGATQPGSMLELRVPTPPPRTGATIDAARYVDVAQLALGLLASIAETLRWLVGARLLELGDLGRLGPEPRHRALATHARNLSIGERMKLSHMLGAHPLRRRLPERPDLLLGAPGPSSVAPLHLAGNLSLVDVAEEPCREALEGRVVWSGGRRLRVAVATPSTAPPSTLAAALRFGGGRARRARRSLEGLLARIVPGLGQGGEYPTRTVLRPAAPRKRRVAWS